MYSAYNLESKENLNEVTFLISVSFELLLLVNV